MDEINDILFEFTPGISAAILPDAPRFTIVAVNNNFVKTLGIKKENAIGKGVFELFSQSPTHSNFTGEQNLNASFHHVMLHKEPDELPLQRHFIRNADGSFSERYWQTYNAPVLNPKGHITYIIHTSFDITAHVKPAQREETVPDLKKAENTLKESEERFRTMANSIPQLAWMTDEKGWIYWYNQRWYDYTGTTPEEMLGWGWKKVHHPDLVKGVVDRFKKAIEAGSPWEDIFLLRGREGEYRWFLSRSVPVRKNGTLIGWFGTNTDITEQRKIEEKLKTSEQQLLLALEGGELGYYDYDPRTGELIWSARTKELLGLPEDAPIDYEIYLNAIHPDDRERNEVAIQKALKRENGGRYENVYRIIGVKDGQLRWVRSKGKAFFDKQGKAYRLAGVTFDITRRKEAEEALQQSENNLRNLILQAPVAMCIGSGPSFIVEVANNRMLELWGKQPEEIMRRPVFEVLKEAGEQGLKEVIHRVYDTGERFTANEMPVSLPRNGKITTAYVNFVYEPIRSDGEITKIVAVASDVTDQVVARKKIEETHREFQFLIDFVPQIIWLTHPDGYHYYYNKQWYDYTGLTYGETKGEGWNHVFHPDDQERAWNVWRQSLAAGEPYEIEYRCRRHDGQYRWFLGRAVPLRDESGNIIKWFGTCTDIHDQKTFAEKLEKQVAERTKELHQSNEDLQQFVHVASHDLREPVRKIEVFVTRLFDESNECLDDRGRYYLDRVKAAANRISVMLEGVLAYSTVLALEEIYEPIDLNKVIKDVEFDLELAIHQKGATIHYSNLPKLQGAPVMLHQVFYNLISNALKFVRSDVAPVIKISSQVIQQRGKPFAKIVLQDNGIGFEQKFAEKIFGTFTRLHSKDKYEGTGLGLSLCKKIVERHGGSIVAKGAEAKGTTFEIMLPVKK